MRSKHMRHGRAIGWCTLFVGSGWGFWKQRELPTQSDRPSSFPVGEVVLLGKQTHETWEMNWLVYLLLF
jgi:hypothetical protein